MAKTYSTNDPLQRMQQVVKYALRQKLLIGIPAEKNARPDGTATNAQLGYWHEYGAPEANLPARPFLAPGMEKAEPMIVAELARAMMKGIERAGRDGDVSGGKAAIDEGLNRVGLRAVDIIKGQITAGLSPPLAERTVYARLHRKKNRRTGPDMKPLIDTGQLLRSISYVIRR